MKTVTLFGVTMSLTAFIIALMGVVVSLVIVVSFPKIWPFGVLFMLMTFLGAYNVNCVVYGHCKVFAWFLTVMFLLNAVTIFFSAAQLNKAVANYGKPVKTSPGKRLR